MADANKFLFIADDESSTHHSLNISADLVSGMSKDCYDARSQNVEANSIKLRIKPRRRCAECRAPRADMAYCRGCVEGGGKLRLHQTKMSPPCLDVERKVVSGDQATIDP